MLFFRFFKKTILDTKIKNNLLPWYKVSANGKHISLNKVKHGIFTGSK